MFTPPCVAGGRGSFSGAAEVATLAACYRAAFIGPASDVRNAQNFYDRWRPGFTARLRTWAPYRTERRSDNPSGSAERPTRFDL